MVVSGLCPGCFPGCCCCSGWCAEFCAKMLCRAAFKCKFSTWLRRSENTDSWERGPKQSLSMGRVYQPLLCQALHRFNERPSLWVYVGCDKNDSMIMQHSIQFFEHTVTVHRWWLARFWVRWGDIVEVRCEDDGKWYPAILETFSGGAAWILSDVFEIWITRSWFWKNR